MADWDVVDEIDLDQDVSAEPEYTGSVSEPDDAALPPESAPTAGPSPFEPVGEIDLGGFTPTGEVDLAADNKWSRTTLPPEQEEKFQRDFAASPFYKEFLARHGEPPDLEGDYDYRLWWLDDGLKATRSPHDDTLHGPSKTKDGRWLKSPDHPTAWKEEYLQKHGVDPDAVGANGMLDPPPNMGGVTPNLGEFTPTGEIDLAGGEYTPLQSAGMGAVEGAIPNTAALAAGVGAGFGLAAVGAPAVVPILGGIGVGIGAAYLAGLAQDKVYELLGIKEHFDKAKQDNELSYHAGNLASGLAFLRPGTGLAPVAERVLSGGIGGLFEAGSAIVQGETPDARKVAMTAAAGAAFPSLNRLGQKFADAGTSAGNAAAARYRGGNTPPAQTQNGNVGGENPTPAPNEPPAPQLDDITVANDAEITAAAMATEQPPAPEIPGAGNPVGAPMAAREAARPSDPTRDYGKPLDSADPSSPGVAMTQGQIAPDLALARGASEPQAPQQQPAAAPPAAEAPPPQDYAARQQAAVQTAQKAGMVGDIQKMLENGQTPAQIAGMTDGRLSPAQVSAVRDFLVEKNLLRPDIARNAPTPVADLPPPEPAPLKPQEKEKIAWAREQLTAKGDTDALKYFDALSPKDQAKGAYQLFNAANSQTGELKPTAQNTSKVATRHKLKSGKAAAGKEDAARKDSVAGVFESVFNDLGPSSERGRKVSVTRIDKAGRDALKAYAKEVLAEAKARNGGKDPLGRLQEGGYRPRHKGEHTSGYEWLKAIKAAAGGRYGPITQLHIPEKPQRGKIGDNQPPQEGPSLADLRASERTIDLDIQRKPQLPDYVTNEIFSTLRAPETGRIPLEKWADPKGEESAVYGKQQQALRDWINKLEDPDYDRLKDIHPELEANVRATQDPAELFINLQDDLLKAQTLGRRPGQVTHPPDDEGGRVIPLKTGEQITLSRTAGPPAKSTAAGTKASEARVLDKNSPEFKRIAAEFAAQQPKKFELSTEERLAQARQAEGSDPLQAAREAPTMKKIWDDTEGGVSVGKAIDGTSAKKFLDDVTATVKKLWADESGAIKPKAGKQKTPKPTKAQQQQAVANAQANPTSPVASPDAQAYADDLYKKWRKLTADITNYQTEVYLNMKKALEYKLTPYERRKIAIADQSDTVKSLSPELQGFHALHIAPLKKRGEALYKELSDMNTQNNLGLDIPAMVRGITKQYQPRRKVGEQMWDAKSDDLFDPFSGRSMGAWNPSIERREWFTLQDVGPNAAASKLKGDRLTVQLEGDAAKGFKVTIYRKGMPTVVQKVPAGFDGEVGSIIPLKVGGKASRWQLDHAGTDEIEKATRGNVKYHEDALYVWSKYNVEMTKAVEQVRLKLAIQQDPDFKALAVTSLDDAKARGYDGKQTSLPDFEKYYMPTPMRWAFDDYHQPGFGPAREGIEALRNFNVGMMKVFNTWAPYVHDLNVADMYVVDRGYRWIPGMGHYRGMWGDALTAWKSVNSQDEIQREMRAAGANPLLASVWARTMWKDYAKAQGLEIIRNPSKWDPVAKLYNDQTAGELGHAMYNLSSDQTWRLADMLHTMRYLEEKRAAQKRGLTGKDAQVAAAERVNKIMGDYSIGAKVMGSRAFQQFLLDPATTIFGRYKHNVWKAYGNILGDLLKKNKTLAERGEALSQIAVMGAMAAVMYPMISAGLAALTGEEDIELKPRGLSAPVTAVTKSASGEGVQRAFSHMWSPAPWIPMTMDVARNRDFAGKPIIPREDLLAGDVGVIPESAVALGDYFLQQAIPPYGIASKAYARPDARPMDPVTAVAGDFFGVSNPSAKSVRYKEQGDRHRNVERKQRENNAGIIPDLYYKGRDLLGF